MSKHTKQLFEMDAFEDSCDNDDYEDAEIKYKNEQRALGENLYVNLRLCIAEERIALLQNMRPCHMKKLQNIIYE